MNFDHAQPSVRLRFIRRGRSQVLQQYWEWPSRYGQWRDVALVDAAFKNTVVVVVLENEEEVEHSHEGYIVTAEPTEHGDLVVYRNHENMLAPQSVASYAAGSWKRHYRKESE